MAKEHLTIRSMEAVEVQEFLKDVEEARESRLTHVSLAISVLAVLVALVTVLGHRAHTEAVLQQARAADQWNQYQSRKLRVQQVEIARDMLTLQPVATTPAVEARVHEYEGRLSKWEPELDRDADAARDLEADVNHVERKAARFDLGEALLQIAVVLSSITLLTRQRVYFLLGLALGIAGAIWAATALLVH